jgi:Flp pilus assembly protein TadG
LVIGMVVCLLLLGAAVTAATSAFLARQRLQNACDGAAAAAADAAQVDYYVGDSDGQDDPATAAAGRYLQARSPGVHAVADTTDGAVRLTCTTESAIAMGALFGVGTLRQSVQAVGRAVL